MHYWLLILALILLFLAAVLWFSWPGGEKR